MTSAFLSLALASALIVLVMIRRSWFDLIWVLTGSLFLAVLDFRVMEQKEDQEEDHAEPVRSHRAAAGTTR